MEEKFATYLVKHGILTEEQLRKAMREKKETGQKIS